MLKKLLLALGLSKAPAPLRSYVKASSLMGVLPALAFVAWKYRDQIKPLIKRGQRQLSAASSRRSAASPMRSSVEATA